MIDKNNLKNIGGLNISDTIATFSEVEYQRYCELLEVFVDKLPAWELALKEHFKAGRHEEFIDALMELKGALIKIHGDDLAIRCDGLLKSIKDPNRDMAEASLSYFLTASSMLSIEIQMAKHKQGPATAAAPTAATTATAAKSENQEQKSILAVDDVPLLLSTLRSVLMETNYKFTGVTSGMAALKYLSSHTVDLFVLDIEMPEMNGYELAQRIKADGHSAPIIFLTGNAKKEYVLKAMQLGAVDFIVKPVNKEQVLEKIHKNIG